MLDRGLFLFSSVLLAFYKIMMQNETNVVSVCVGVRRAGSEYERTQDVAGVLDGRVGTVLGLEQRVVEGEAVLVVRLGGHVQVREVVLGGDLAEDGGVDVVVERRTGNGVGTGSSRGGRRGRR